MTFPRAKYYSRREWHFHARITFPRALNKHTFASAPGFPRDNRMTYIKESTKPTTSRIFFLACKPADDKFRRIPAIRILVRSLNTNFLLDTKLWMGHVKFRFPKKYISKKPSPTCAVSVTNGPSDRLNITLVPPRIRNNKRCDHENQTFFKDMLF